MSKVINIGNVDYTFEFTMEASLYNECTERITGLMLAIEDAESKKDIKAILTGVSDIPQVALTMFYAGLLEHHGVDGDNTITTKSDAKQLIKQFITEHKDDDLGSFYGVMNEMIAIMGDDGFFDLIGLSKMFQAEQKQVKKPQDHKKKVTKKTETTEK